MRVLLVWLAFILLFVATPVHADVAAAISAANTWTEPLNVRGPVKGSAGFNVSVWGTFIATVTLQRSFDGGTTWLEVNSWTAPVEARDEEPEGALYRIGVDAGDYTSGTVNVRLGQ